MGKIQQFNGDNDKYIKIKIKLYGDEINRRQNKHQKKMHHISAYH